MNCPLIIQDLVSAVDVKVQLLGRHFVGQYRGHLGGGANFGSGNVNQELSKTRKLSLAEDLGEVVSNVEFGRAPQALNASRFSVVALSIANAEVAKLDMLGLRRDLGVAGGRDAGLVVDEQRDRFDRVCRGKVK